MSVKSKQLSKDPLNLIITGVGGQGNVMIALIVGNALVRKGYLVTIGETYGLSQRGGPVMSHLRISADSQYSPFIPDGHAHIILGMEPVETLRMLNQYGNPDVITIFNPRPIYSIDVTSGSANYPKIEEAKESIKSLSAKTWIINATEEAQKMGNPIFANMILIGALLQTSVLPLDKKSTEAVIQEMFPLEVGNNLKALNKGMELAAL
jgi:indolepyruvate ferredoxin oxidoreductase beta subunit